MSVDPGVLSAGITAAGTIAVAAIGRLPGKGRDAAMREEMEIARLLADMDDGSQEMRELRAEVVRDMLDDARARRREREESSAASVLSVASLYPFLTFFACWLVVYIAVGGTFEDGRLPLAVLLCAACTLLDVAAHLLSALHSARRRR
nr:MAG TPA: hypothetical protein [Caudoviricetes sp.]